MRRTVLERGIFSGMERELLEDIMGRSAVGCERSNGGNVGEVLHGGQGVAMKSKFDRDDDGAVLGVSQHFLDGKEVLYIDYQIPASRDRGIGDVTAQMPIALFVSD